MCVCVTHIYMTVSPAAWKFRRKSVKPGGLDFENTVVRRKSVKIKFNVCRNQQSLLVVVRHEFSAPVTGITMCTQVGGHSGIRFDIGLSVNSIPQGKEWLNGKVRRPSTGRCFNKWFMHVYAHLQNRNGSSRAAEGGGGKRFMGGIVKKNHGTNETAAGWTIGVNVFEADTSIRRPGLDRQPLVIGIGDAWTRLAIFSIIPTTHLFTRPNGTRMFSCCIGYITLIDSTYPFTGECS